MSCTDCAFVGRALRCGARIVLFASLTTKGVDATTPEPFEISYDGSARLVRRQRSGSRLDSPRGAAVEVSPDGSAHLIGSEPSGTAIEVSYDGSTHLSEAPSEPACESQCVLKTAPDASGSLPAKSFTEAAALFLDAASFHWRCLQTFRQRDSRPEEALESECSAPNFKKGVRGFLKRRVATELSFDEWPGFLEQVATAGDWMEILDAELDAVQTAIKVQFAAHLAVVFAARQAYVALGSLQPCAVQGVLKEISQQMNKLLASMRASLPSTNAKGPWTHGWRSSIVESERLFSYLKTPKVASLLAHAEDCARPFNYAGLTSELAIEQRERVQPPLPAISNDSVIMLRGPGGVPTAMPLLGLGTGYDDCYRGFLLKPVVFSESAEETLKLTTEKCHPIAVPEDWSMNSRFTLVETAALYGSERAVGTAMAEVLRRPGRSRKEFFVVTKPPTKAVWQMLGVKSSTAYLSQQLKDLQTDYADVILNHHDDIQPEVWASMESAVAEGRGRMLGVTGNDQAEHVADCVSRYVRAGRGCKIMPAIAEMDFNPCSAAGIQKLGPQAETAKVTILGSSTVWPCVNEPHMNAIAQRHGVSSPAVSLRFALQNGVPSLVQTHKTSQFRAATKALEINLSDLEMAHIWILPLLYRFDTADNFKESFADGPGLRALGIEDSRALLGFFENIQPRSSFIRVV